MSRYIDLDEAKARTTQLIHGYEVEQWLDTIPSIDIVRCRECRYCKKKRGTFKGEPITFYRCEENNRDVDSDDFCSYGDKRDD